MTIQSGARSLKRRSRPQEMLSPLGPPKNRTAEVAERLAGEIVAGRLRPGAQLPTEHAMMAAFGVSRTVLREAVAALRAEGLVLTRQGLGAFVTSDNRRRPFRIDPDGLQSIAEVINVMELRLAVEVEAAGLAASRATRALRRRVGDALAAIDGAIARGEAAIDEDVAFHRAIAAATGNPRFTQFLEYLGRFIIPRQSIRVEPARLSDPLLYLKTIQNEHRILHAAIDAGDEAAARTAMRDHLTNGKERYRRLMGAPTKG